MLKKGIRQPWHLSRCGFKPVLVDGKIYYAAKNSLIFPAEEPGSFIDYVYHLPK